MPVYVSPPLPATTVSPAAPPVIEVGPAAATMIAESVTGIATVTSGASAITATPPVPLEGPGAVDPETY